MDAEEFQKECIGKGRIRPIATLAERQRWAANFQGLADKNRAAARELIGTRGEDLVVGRAALAMEMKANEWLAWSGWHSKSHVCTQAALSKLLDRADLAGPLSIAYNDRRLFDYTNDPGDMRFADSFEEFCEKADEYMVSVDRAIEFTRKALASG